MDVPLRQSLKDKLKTSRAKARKPTADTVAGAPLLLKEVVPAKRER
jgi:hypothetical protein